MDRHEPGSVRRPPGPPGGAAHPPARRRCLAHPHRGIRQASPSKLADIRVRRGFGWVGAGWRAWCTRTALFRKLPLELEQAVVVIHFSVVRAQDHHGKRMQPPRRRPPAGPGRIDLQDHARMSANDGVGHARRLARAGDSNKMMALESTDDLACLTTRQRCPTPYPRLQGLDVNARLTRERRLVENPREFCQPAYRQRHIRLDVIEN